jgi:signal peptidase II
MKRATYIFFIFLTVTAIDQITKHFIINYLSFSDSVEIFSFLHIVNIRNTGAAFGIFKSLGGNFFIAISVAAIIFVTNLLIRRIYNDFGLSLVLGGAIGNLIDRIFYGKVVDFIDFSIGRFHWPAFNVADSALTIGIMIIFLTSISKKK